MSSLLALCGLCERSGFDFLMSGNRLKKKQTKTQSTHIDLHAPVQAVVEQKVVCHANPVRFHGVALAVVVIPDIAFE